MKKALEPLTLQDAKRIRTEAETIAATHKTPLAQQMLRYWKEHRPQMDARLRRLGVLNQFAVVLEERYDQDLVRLMTEESMQAGDAAQIAGEHLLMTPESQEQETTEPQLQLDQTTT